MKASLRFQLRDARSSSPRFAGVLMALGGLFALGAQAFASAAPAAQVPVLQDRTPPEFAEASNGVVWKPSVTLELGATLAVLGEEVSLAYEPSAALQTGAIVPGGVRAPFRLETELGVSVQAEPGLRPVPLIVREPSASMREAAGEAADQPRLGPGHAFLLWSKEDPAASWAYLRVLEVTSSSARLELAEFAGSVPFAERDPAHLSADAGAGLSWTSIPSASSGAEKNAPSPSYVVERRALGERDWVRLAAEVLPSADGLYRLDDPLRFAEPPTVYEYRVMRGARGGPFVGAFVRAHGFANEAAKVAPASRINLVSGRSVEAGEAAHLTIGRSAPGSLVLEPVDGVSLNGVLAAEKQEFASWRLPDPSEPTWLPGKAVRIRDGDEVAFLLPNGLAGRIRMEELTSERWLLRREVCYDGTGLLPRPPGPPLKAFVEPTRTAGEGSGRLSLSLAGPPQESGVDPRGVGFVLEHQPSPGSGGWEMLAATGSGSTTFELEDAFKDGRGGRRPLARLRLRYQIPFGPASAPGEPFDILSSGGDSVLRFKDLDGAIADLAAKDFERRRAASVLIGAMGDDARPALEALALTSAGTPEGLAARDLLRALDERGGAGKRLAAELRSLALQSLRGRDDLSEDWLGEMPPGLSAKTARVRAHALLLAVDRASRGGTRTLAGETVADDCERALSWARASAAADPDEGVRWLARFISELGVQPSLASFEPEGPAWLLPRDRRVSVERFDFGWGDQPSAAEELRWQLEARPELADLRLGPVLCRLHAALAPGEQLTRIYAQETPDLDGPSDRLAFEEPRLFDYDSSLAELVLRLVERARRPDADPVLLSAAESLLPDARLSLEAWRSVSDRRLATPSADAVPRKRIELSGGSLGVLNATLSELSGDASVDVVLSAGSWKTDADELAGQENARLVSTSLVIRCNDIRLIGKGDGPVRLHAGLRVYGQNVVLQDLVLDCAQSQALTVLDGGHVAVVGCELRGVGTVVHLQGGTAEIFESELGAADPANPPATSVRLILQSRLYGRASLFDAGSIFISTGAEVWLDRCVLDAGSRMVVQGQDRAVLNVRESLLRGQGSGLFRVSSGLLVGSVIDVPRDPLGRLPQSLHDGGLRLSPRFFHLVQEGQEVPPAMRLDVEPLVAPSASGQSPR